MCAPPGACVHFSLVDDHFSRTWKSSHAQGHFSILVHTGVCLHCGISICTFLCTSVFEFIFYLCTQSFISVFEFKILFILNCTHNLSFLHLTLLCCPLGNSVFKFQNVLSIYPLYIWQYYFCPLCICLSIHFFVFNPTLFFFFLQVHILNATLFSHFASQCLTC